MLKRQQNVKLQQKLQKVLHCCPTLNQTFVILAIKRTGTECIVHVDKNGKVIAQKEFKNSNFYPFASFTQSHVAFLHTQDNFIIQWNLQTHEFIQVPFLFSNQSQTRQIFTFPEHSYFCILEHGGPNNNFFKLSYFKYPIISKQHQPFYVYDSESDGQVWTYDYQVRRGNTSSMILWFKNSFSEAIEFRSFNLEDKQVKNHKAINNISAQKFQISVGQIWQKNKGQFIITTLTDRQKVKLVDEKGQQYDEYPNSIFICSDDNDELRQAHFALDGKFRIQYIDCMPFGHNAMFRTFEFNEGVASQSPVYYVNHELEAIVEKDTWKCSHLSKYQVVGYDANLLIETQFENGDVEWVNFITIKIINVKETAAMFLIDILPTVDEDLMREVIGIIAVENV